MSAPAPSTFVDVDGPVHVADLGGPRDAPALVCVHGLAGSHVAWRSMARELSDRYRVLAIDLPGHGRSPSAGRSAAVGDAATTLARVLDELRLPPVTLVGHSMGAAASVLAAATSPGAVERLVLLAPPLPRVGVARLPVSLLPHIALCLFPPAGRHALRLRLRRTGLVEHVEAGLRLTCGSVEGLAEIAAARVEELEAAMAAGEDPVATFVEAARSVGLLVARGTAYRRALLAAPGDALVVHGAGDRVVPTDGGQALRDLRPRWRTEVLDDVGHSPHLEAPDVVAGLLHRFVAGTGRPAGRTLSTVATGATGWRGEDAEGPLSA
ncbi:alpha/beta fold hydrolase [Nocardioides sp. SYSU D00038]|uniref:alpha/beta fold hydrolase n=1 Tax=Nocardioides sp. SYSU D00038 TaxID=2812554 RepID=UPI00196705E9|nr:alpha/beta hydrolase [Nocardioides sp. SYSU D00038]